MNWLLKRLFKPSPALPKRSMLLVICTLALTGAVQLWRMPLALTLFVMVMIGARLLLVRHNAQCKSWLLWLLAFIYLAQVLLFYGGISGYLAGGALLIGMLALKLLEAQTLRDLYIAVFLSYFLLALNFLAEQSIGFAILAIAQLALVNFALSGIAQSDAPNRQQLIARGKFSLLVVVQAAPLMLLLFVLFPRISGPLWALPKMGATAKTGFSETMQPGNISKLAKTAGVAFRVQFASGRSVPQHLLYFRALTLWHYDGYTWSALPTYLRRIQNTADNLQIGNTSIDYQISMEAHGSRALFALDMPSKFSTAAGEKLSLNQSLELSRERVVDEVFAYRLSSALEYKLSPQLGKNMRALALQLPKNSNPHSIALGRKLATQAIGTADPTQHIINQILNMFHREHFHYTLNPPPQGRDKADDFLFKTKAGFCEDYSSAMVLLLRAADVPARVVVGYQGGDYNSLTGELVVRQADAHAWVEAWTPTQGWQRIDPTAAVSPARIDHSLEQALPEQAGELALLSRRQGASFISFSADILDAIDSYWNRWILGYGPQLQQRFLGKLGLDSLYKIIVALAISAAVLLSIMLVLILRPPKRKLNQADKIMAQFYKKLKIKRPSHLAVGDFLDSIAKRHQVAQSALLEIATIYNSLQYQQLSSHSPPQLKAACSRCLYLIKTQNSL